MSHVTDLIERRPRAARPDTLLRRVLIADAAASGAMAVLGLAGAGMLDSVLGLPAALLRTAGLSLVPFAAFVAYVATRETLPRPAVWAIIALNALWVAESFLLMAGSSLAPTTLGQAFVIAQAAAVALLAELEYVGLRRSVAVAA
jgi:hypothetical protein